MLIIWGEYAIIYLTVGRSNLLGGGVPPGPEVHGSAGSPAPQSSLPVQPANELSLCPDHERERRPQVAAWLAAEGFGNL
ncbi:unnamed protein product, partial [Bubo scandiacus]